MCFCDGGGGVRAGERAASRQAIERMRHALQANRSGGKRLTSDKFASRAYI